MCLSIVHLRCFCIEQWHLMQAFYFIYKGAAARLLPLVKLPLQCFGAVPWAF